MRSDHQETLEAEIARLDGLGLHELRQVWRQRLGPPPRHISADLTRRRLAYELQVREYGGLKPETRRRLRQYYKAFKANPHHTPSSNLGLKPGVVLAREWNGAEHRVTVLEKGFEHRGEQYQSLSQVARRISGSRWSGPAFFGPLMRQAALDRRGVLFARLWTLKEAFVKATGDGLRCPLDKFAFTLDPIAIRFQWGPSRLEAIGSSLSSARAMGRSLP